MSIINRLKCFAAGLLAAAALNANAQTTPFQGGTGIANNNAATLTRSGNHALTLTTTGTTNVTLPTSGTLATTANALTIGRPVVGGGANQVLFDDASQNLGSSANFVWDGSHLIVNALARFGGTGNPAQALDATTSVTGAATLVTAFGRRAANSTTLYHGYADAALGATGGPALWVTGTAGPTSLAGDLIIQGRGDTARSIYFYTGNTPTNRLSIGSTGTISMPGLPSDAATTNNTVCATTTSGALTIGSGTSGTCLGTSSARFKTEIADLQPGLSEIVALRPVSYKTDAEHGDPSKTLYGFTAEEGGAILPQLMAHDEKGLPNTFDYMGLIPVLVNAIKTQQKQIDALKRQITANYNGPQ